MSSYIGKININNTEYPIAQSLFGTCNTTANTATKVVTCADFDTLISGIVINVYFTYANTESSISLNVNSTGNKTVYIDNNSSILWDAGATKSFVYYNNQWRLINPTSIGTTYDAATTSANGLMSSIDKFTVLHSPIGFVTGSTLYYPHDIYGYDAYGNSEFFYFYVGAYSTVKKLKGLEGQTGLDHINVNKYLQSGLYYGRIYDYDTFQVKPIGNITGTGTSGSLLIWSNTSNGYGLVNPGTVTDGPALGSDTTTFLRNDGTWATPTGATYSAATTAADGLMSSSDKTKLDILDPLGYVPILTTGTGMTGTVSNHNPGSLFLQYNGEGYNNLGSLTNLINLNYYAEKSLIPGEILLESNYTDEYTQSRGAGTSQNHKETIEINSKSGIINLNSYYNDYATDNYQASTISLIDTQGIDIYTSSDNDIIIKNGQYYNTQQGAINYPNEIKLLGYNNGIEILSDNIILIGSRTTSGVVITQVIDPINEEDAVNKRYVDNSIASIPASTYAAGSGLSLSGTTFNHTNSITASSVGSSVATSGATLDIPYAKYDAQGHITAKGTHVHTIGSLAASAITSGTFATARIPSLPTSIITSGTFATARIPNLPASVITSGTLGTAILPTVPIAKGGTGATTAAAARTNLGLGSAAVASTSASVGNNSNLPTGSAIQSYVTGLGYEANQNAFSNVIVGSSTVAADSKTDTLTLVGNKGVSLSANTSSDTITISGTTYGNATTAAAGLMSATDKQALGKWDDVELDKTQDNTSMDIYIPYLVYTNSSEAKLIKSSEYPAPNAIARYYYDYVGSYLTSTTPSTSTNSTVVATTLFVHNLINASGGGPGKLTGIKILSTDSLVSPIGTSTTAFRVTHGLEVAEEFSETVYVKSSGATGYERAVYGSREQALGIESPYVYYSISNINDNYFDILFSTAPSTFKILLNVDYSVYDPEGFTNGDNISYGGN